MNFIRYATDSSAYPSYVILLWKLSYRPFTTHFNQLNTNIMKQVLENRNRQKWDTSAKICNQPVKPPSSQLKTSHASSLSSSSGPTCKPCFGVKKTHFMGKQTVYRGFLMDGHMKGLGFLTSTSQGQLIDLCGLNDQKWKETNESKRIEIEGNFQHGLELEESQGYATQMKYWMGDELLWTFQGNFESGLPHGEGCCTFHTLEDIVYDGVWNRGQMVWGSANMDKDGRDRYIYIGDFKGGRPEGKARVEYTNGDVYEGDWYNGQPHGDGRMVYDTGDIYDGQFKNGFLDGWGRMDYKENMSYIGSWALNARNGVGKMIFKDQDCFEGTWKRNDMVVGTMHFFESSIDRYEGMFKDMTLDGFGSIWYSDGDFYEGEFREGDLNGKGQMTLSNGNIYNGEWADGSMCKSNGKIFYSHDQSIYEGSVVNFERNGFGTLTYRNGELRIDLFTFIPP